MNFNDYLKKINACNDAVKWVGDRDMQTAWKDCERADFAGACKMSAGFDGNNA